MAGLLSWGEIRKNAIEFSKEWKGTTSEKSEAHTFWDQFFEVFGVPRRRVATFERPAIKTNDSKGFIDLFWKGTLLVEHKSAGVNLDTAYSQALDYFNGLKNWELPKYIVVSNFEYFRVYNLEAESEEEKIHEFPLEELYKNIHLFDFIIGHTQKKYKDEDPVNIKAAELMGKLHDSLKASGYTGHNLEVFLVRIMFCLFADDTGIFPHKHQFRDYLDRKKDEDGGMLGVQISIIFQTLNKPYLERQKNLPEDIKTLPYINGALFAEILEDPIFDKEMQDVLMECCYFDWGKVSPAIFGSMFQSVMNNEQRRDIGAHYTSEKNIIKTIKSLFLDELYEEFNKIISNPNKNTITQLDNLFDRISNLKFLDPACGCGNFLIIAYRELRLLQLEILKKMRELRFTSQHDLYKDSIQSFLGFDLSRFIDVDAMYGIEIEEFPCRIAETALWIVDHQMNIKLFEEFNDWLNRLPIKKKANITIGNSLRMDWNTVIPNTKVNYILGNPPYVGKKRRSTQQNEDMDLVCKDVENYGLLDYVCAWYIKAAEYIQGTNIKVAYVSTNSIAQGEQVGILWKYLLKKNIKINFAHRTFAWYNEGRNVANVYVVIIGFSTQESTKKVLFDYSTPTSEPTEIKVANINPYLVNADNIIIEKRRAPICNVPTCVFGSMPNDNGNLLLSDQEKQEFIEKDPRTEEFIKQLISSDEFINGQKRWCIWLYNVPPSKYSNIPIIMERIEKVRAYRLASTRAQTKRKAETPYLFAEIRQPNTDYILIPRHSSEQRKYIPMTILPNDYIASDSCIFANGPTPYRFGILMSTMHMSWVRHVCGRIKSDYRYSNEIVYNNFPWPENPSDARIKEVEDCAKAVLELHKKYANEKLADLYDPLTMPQDLLEAHKKLDRAVDKCYRTNQFNNEHSRIEFLFELYKKYVTA